MLWITVLMGLMTSISSDSLLRLVLVVSNGELTPPISLKTTQWTEGLEQLTQEGMEQEFLNGVFIRDTYFDEASELYLLDRNLHTHLIEVQSSPKEANLISTEAFLTGVWYESSTDPSSPDLHPIPVYESEYLDVMECIGRREIATKEEMSTWDIISYWGQNQDKIYDLYEKVGYHGGGINMIEQLYHLLKYQEKMGITQEYALEKYEQLIVRGHELIWESKKSWGIDSTRALAGKALSELTSRIEECRDTNCTTDELVLVYTSSVDTLAWIQNALGFYDGAQPEPSTMLQFEVWRMDNGSVNGSDVYVKIKQTLDNETREMSITNCTVLCPVDQFVERGQLYSASPEDLETLCADADYLLSLLTERVKIILLATGGVFVVFGMFLYISRGKSSSEISLEKEKTRWSKLLQEDDGF